jgi:hypothetical protein
MSCSECSRWPGSRARRCKSSAALRCRQRESSSCCRSIVTRNEPRRRISIEAGAARLFLVMAWLFAQCSAETFRGRSGPALTQPRAAVPTCQPSAPPQSPTDRTGDLTPGRAPRSSACDVANATDPRSRPERHVVISRRIAMEIDAPIRRAPGVRSLPLRRGDETALQDGGTGGRRGSLGTCQTSGPGRSDPPEHRRSARPGSRENRGRPLAGEGPLWLLKLSEVRRLRCTTGSSPRRYHQMQISIGRWQSSDVVSSVYWYRELGER